MIGVKEAVKIAFELFEELYDTKKFEDVLLEEVELSGDNATWIVTIGFARQAPSVNIMESIGSKKYMRSFKKFEINAASGQMVSMKNFRYDTAADIYGK